MINSKMKDTRKKLNFTQSQLAKETKHLSQQGINWIEAGNPPSIQAALVIADCLHETVESLFGQQVFPERSEIAVAMKMARLNNTTVEQLYSDIFLK